MAGWDFGRSDVLAAAANEVAETDGDVSCGDLRGLAFWPVVSGTLRGRCGPSWAAQDVAGVVTVEGAQDWSDAFGDARNKVIARNSRRRAFARSTLRDDQFVPALRHHPEAISPKKPLRWCVLEEDQHRILDRVV